MNKGRIPHLTIEQARALLKEESPSEKAHTRQVARSEGDRWKELAEVIEIINTLKADIQSLQAQWEKHYAEHEKKKLECPFKKKRGKDCPAK